jgi:uncharacterized protein (TIGR00106 family)
MAIMDIQVSPRRTGSVSVSDAVIAAQRVIHSSGLKHILHPMGTCVEGERRRLYELAAEIHEALARMGFERIGIVLKIDERLDKPQTMEDKLRSIE